MGTRGGSRTSASLEERPVKARPLWQQAVENILGEIRGGQLRSGQRVVEAHLQRTLRVSRNPIREAIRQLEQRNILEYRPNVGTVVATYTREDATIIVENRIFLEKKAMQLITEHDRLANLAGLERIVDEMSKRSPDAPIQSVERLDYAFHDFLVQAAENTMLRKLWETLDPVTKMIIYTWQTHEQAFTEDLAVEYESHRRLLEVLRGSSLTVAQDAIDAHIQRSWHTTVSYGEECAGE